MANRLFQQARQYVEMAKDASGNGNQQELISKAKNALSSAYANSTFAEQQQLQELQSEIDRLK
ncbi:MULTISPECIES: DUF3813 domain-containing protein [Heyndrickxia]|jgi:polyhydroxyalkanoate synthesis regulator phasin|uniref:DUF3813 domain-containing protein n=1 Tax=Heyndrickxia oleronia TaxID=38875 RepID=A0AAW6T5B9_9BACI|nr:DUF3813 domain-containing protein [Heyndrickxia oleronia]NYV67736.1 DUF3813 domain-containing protein [Bacillus sp. Gen3]OJH17628.1 hypothetical protein BLX88_17400 [Bacillus obstructivus]MBU5211793.1 DUF3813 domain-containing protein [Heyndrickxia oleronia]MCI1593185.1 DUF3813 domain-containing protein [Heyndrickxia oleronia]MCI1611255.1 DUF3813 domain-containing protein [Heyndrickxia oleronia]